MTKDNNVLHLPAPIKGNNNVNGKKKKKETNQRKKKKKNDNNQDGNLMKKQKRSRNGTTTKQQHDNDGTSSPFDDFDLNLDTFVGPYNSELDNEDVEVDVDGDGDGGTNNNNNNNISYYEAQAGKKIPIDKYMLQLISLVCNNNNNNNSSSSSNNNNGCGVNTAFMVLDNPISPTYTHENEPEKYRLMRLQIRHRFAAAAAGGISPLDFARKLLQLWGGKLVEIKMMKKKTKKQQQQQQQRAVERKTKRKKIIFNKKNNNNKHVKTHVVVSDDIATADDDDDDDVALDINGNGNGNNNNKKIAPDLALLAPESALFNSPPNLRTTMKEKMIDKEQQEWQIQTVKQSVTPSPEMFKTSSMMLSEGKQTIKATPQKQQQTKQKKVGTVVPSKQKQVLMNQTAAIYVNDENQLVPLDDHVDHVDHVDHDDAAAAADPGQYYYYYVNNNQNNDDGGSVINNNDSSSSNDTGGIRRVVVNSLRMATNDDPKNCNALHCFVRAELLEVCIVTNKHNNITIIKNNDDDKRNVDANTITTTTPTTTTTTTTPTTPATTPTIATDIDTLAAAAGEVNTTTAAAAFTPITTNNGVGVAADTYGELAAVTPPAADGGAPAASAAPLHSTTTTTTPGREAGSNSKCRQYPRIGLRCIYCGKHKSSMFSTSKGPGAGAQMSAFFPKSVQDIYRGVCTWQRIHFKNCCYVPDEMKSKYDKLKDADRTRGRKAHWIRSAKLIGLRNVDDGRNGMTFRTFLDEESEFEWEGSNELNEELDE